MNLLSVLGRVAGGSQALQGLCVPPSLPAGYMAWQAAGRGGGAVHTLAHAALGLSLFRRCCAPPSPCCPACAAAIDCPWQLLTNSVAPSLQPSQTPLSPTWGALTGYPGAVGLRPPGATPVKRFAPVMYPTRQAPSESSSGPQQGQQGGEGK